MFCFTINKLEHIPEYKILDMPYSGSGGILRGWLLDKILLAHLLPSFLVSR